MPVSKKYRGAAKASGKKSLEEGCLWSGCQEAALEVQSCVSNLRGGSFQEKRMREVQYTREKSYARNIIQLKLPSSKLGKKLFRHCFFWENWASIPGSRSQDYSAWPKKSGMSIRLRACRPCPWPKVIPRENDGLLTLPRVYRGFTVPSLHLPISLS